MEAVVGLFAVFHGHAHGVEMPVDAAAASYATAFMAATALLHLAGIGIGLEVGSIANASSVRLNRVSGVAMALAGVAVLSGWLCLPGSCPAAVSYGRRAAFRPGPKRGGLRLILREVRDLSRFGRNF